MIDGHFLPIMCVSLRRERATEKRILQRRWKNKRATVKQAFHNYKYQSRENTRQLKLADRPWHQKLADKVSKKFKAFRGR